MRRLLLPITLVASSALALVLLPVLQPKAPLAFLTPECTALMQQMRSLAPDSNGFEVLGEQMKKVCMPSMTGQNSAQSTSEAAPAKVIVSCPSLESDIALCESKQGTPNITKNADGCRHVQCVQDDAPAAGPASPSPQKSSEAASFQPVPEPPAAVLSNTQQSVTCEKKMIGACTILRCSDNTSWDSCACSKAPKAEKKFPKAPRRAAAAQASPATAPTTVECPSEEQIEAEKDACKDKGGIYVTNVGEDTCTTVQCVVQNPADAGTCKAKSYNPYQAQVNGHESYCTKKGGTMSLKQINAGVDECVDWECTKGNAFGIPSCTWKLKVYPYPLTPTEKQDYWEKNSFCAEIVCGGEFHWKACIDGFPKCLPPVIVPATESVPEFKTQKCTVNAYDATVDSYDAKDVFADDALKPCIKYASAPNCSVLECIENGTITKSVTCK